MLKYNLFCTNDHTFEGWFGSEKEYLKQKRKEDDRLSQCVMTQEYVEH